MLCLAIHQAAQDYKSLPAKILESISIKNEAFSSFIQLLYTPYLTFAGPLKLPNNIFV